MQNTSKTNSSSLDRIAYNIYYREQHCTFPFSFRFFILKKKKKEKLERNNKIKNYVDYFYFYLLTILQNKQLKMVLIIGIIYLYY